MQNAESTQHDLQLNYPFFAIHACHPKMKMLHISSRDSFDCLHTFTKFLLARNQATCASFLGAILPLNIIWKPLIILKDSLYHTGSTFGVKYIVYRYFPF